MPQKPVYDKPPILSVSCCFPSNGTVRTTDERIRRLYQGASRFADQPQMWEGLFSLACLTTARPAEEPVAGMISAAAADTEDGSLNGGIAEQVCTARAAFALYEYNTDRTILKRLAAWCRYLEVEFDRLSAQDGLLYRPADLMELLVRLYRVTGLKSTLRLCSRLRAASFDWTTALHTFQQSIPVRKRDGEEPALKLDTPPGEIDYDDRETLINHAETLADGMRYTLYSGLFSGHGQDLSAGRTVWSHLQKHHRAICGGTTADPFLCGSAPDRPVNTRALAAWTEAFATQTQIPGSEWAMAELVRTVYNGLADVLNRNETPGCQYVNNLSAEENTEADAGWLYARVCRAAAAAYRCAVTLTEDGMRINYLLPGRVLAMVHRVPVLLDMQDNLAVFRCKKPFSAEISLFMPPTSGEDVCLIRDGKETIFVRRETEAGKGYRQQAEGRWTEGDGFRFEGNGRIIEEQTHHQGACFLAGNRLLSMKAAPDSFSAAYCGTAAQGKDGPSIMAAKTDRWKMKGTQPADIPVLPDPEGEAFPTILKPYSETPCRITMFPRSDRRCLK